MGEDWEAREQARRAGIRGVWRDSFLLGGAAGAALGIALLTGNAAVRAVSLAGFVAAAAAALVVGTVIYFRRIDELEREANLWGGYCAMVVYVVLYLTQAVIARFGTAIPHAHDAIFLLTSGTLIGVYLWKRFR